VSTDGTAPLESPSQPRSRRRLDAWRRLLLMRRHPRAPRANRSIATRLSRKLALVTMLVLGVLFGVTWFGVKMLVMERNTEDLQARSVMIADIVRNAAAHGDDAVVARLAADAPMRASTCLEVWRADGTPLFADATTQKFDMSTHKRVHEFDIATPELAGGLVKARYTIDYTHDAKMGRKWAALLAIITLSSGALVATAVRWHVGREMRPLRALAAQTRSMSASDLDRRLSLRDPAEELLPWIEQFNALMDRLQTGVQQLEAFNADVAHELRTPLAAMIGHAEIALSRERPAESLRETLSSNLEEMQRLSAMVNDMLFLSRADRGAVARRGDPVSLAELAGQVTEFHEAMLEDAGLTLRIDGDARLAVDEALFKRALSNLVGNATRYAERGSTVVVAIVPEAVDARAASGRPEAPECVRVTVENAGQPIAEDHLPKLFDRFFRADTSRAAEGEGQHHGLGLAIVAAIARMHAGHTVVESGAGRTRVGFTLAPGV